LDDRTIPSAYNLASLATEDVLKKGDYPIKYRAYYTLYPANVVTLADPFIITSVDPCDAPVSVTASILIPQSYTITDVAAPYTIPVYTAEPAWCEITYTSTIFTTAGDEVVAFGFDPAGPIFSFLYI
jgi:hypothetical protein